MTDDVERLAKELMSVAKSRVAGKLLQKPDSFLAAKPLLSAVVAASGDNDGGPIGDLDRLLSRAIAALGNTQSKRYPTAIGYQWAATWLFGEDSNRDEITKGSGPGVKDYDKAFDVVVRAADIDDSAQYQRNELSLDIRKRVAQELLKLRDESRRSSDERPVIDRAEIKKEALAALRPDRPVSLWGEPGNGKTFIAKELSNQLALHGRVAILRGPSGDQATLLHTDISDAFKAIGRKVSASSPFALRLAMRKALQEPHTFDVVILDDADEQMIREFAVGTATRTLITRNQELSYEGFKDIPIRAFDETEAVRYLGLRVPSLSEGERIDLARLLGNRPLALHIACRMILEGHTDPQKFIATCKHDVLGSLERSLKTIREPDSKPLRRLYQTAMDTLDNYEQSLLDTMVWLCGSSAAVKVAAYLPPITPSEVEEQQVESAVATLSSLGLVISQAGYLTINGLTQSILKAMRRDVVQVLLTRFESAFLEPAIDIASHYDHTQVGAVVRQYYPEQSAIGRCRRELLSFTAMTASVVGSLVPGSSSGMVPAGDKNLILWQEGVKLFDLPSEALHLAIMSIEDRSFRFWPIDISLTVDEVDPRLHSVMWLSLQACINQKLGSEDGRPGGGIDLLIPRSPEEQENLLHRVVSPVHVGWAAKYKIPVWGECGACFVPRLEDAVAASRRECPICFAPSRVVGTDPQAHWQRIFAAICQVIGYGGQTCYWKQEASACLTLAVLLGEQDLRVMAMRQAMSATWRVTDEDDELCARAVRLIVLLELLKMSSASQEQILSAQESAEAIRLLGEFSKGDRADT